MFNVAIHTVGNEILFQTFHEPLQSYPTVHLSYHLGEQWNSVRRGDDPMIKGKTIAFDDFNIG
jgi:hypothetical protein